jgi:hypothetical protein
MASYPTCEYMAVTQTVQLSTSSQQTGVQYLTLASNLSADTVAPTKVYQGTFQDTSGSDIYYFLSSNAIDENENVAYTFSGSNGSSQNPVYPQPYMARVSSAGVADTPQNTVQGDANDETGGTMYWEEATTVAVDPQDSLTFWGAGQWLNQTQSSCCNWQTQVFVCQAGRTGSNAYCP